MKPASLIFAFLSLNIFAQTNSLPSQDVARGRNKLSLYLEFGRINPGINFPRELIHTPTHPNDLGPNRPPRSQLTPLKKNGVPIWGPGVSIRPFSGKASGLTLVWHLAMPMVSNNFRGGDLANHQPYAFFIPNEKPAPGFPPIPSSEEAYTYSRVSRLNPIPKFGLMYNLEPRNESEFFNLKLGAVCSMYGLTVTQGWDRYNRDEVFNKTSGFGKACGFSGIFKVFLDENSKWVFRIRFEIQKGSMKFSNIPGRHNMLIVNPFSFGFGREF